MSRKCISLTLFCLLCLFVVTPVLPASAAAPVLRITPASHELTEIGEILKIEVRAENVESLYGAEIHLSFDAGKVEVVSASGQPVNRVDVGELLAAPNKFEGANSVNSQTGSIVFACVLLGQVTGKSGNGTVISFHLRVKQLADSALTLIKADLVERVAGDQPTKATPALYHGRLIARSATPGAGSDSPQTPPAPPSRPPAQQGAAHQLDAADLKVTTASIEADGRKVVQTMAVLPETALQQAVNAAATAGEAVRLELPTYGMAEAGAQQQVQFRIPHAGLSGLAGTGLDLVGPSGTTVQVPKALLEQLATGTEDFRFTSGRLDLVDVSNHLESGDEALSAEEIEANLNGATTLRLLAPTGVDPNKLRVRVIHGDGSVESLIPRTVTVDAQKYLEVVINRFSTFIVYKTASGTAAPNHSSIAITLTVNRLDATVDSQPYKLLATPYVVAATGRTMVPVRFISEALGADVEWFPATREVRIVDGETAIMLTIDSNRVLVNGVAEGLDAPATLKPGVTYVPLRMISETLGAEVQFDPASKQISIRR